MEEAKSKIYGYRWVVLIVFMFLNAVLHMQWLIFAPIAKAAQSFYGTSTVGIDMFAMIYMGMFVIMFLPGVYVVNAHGVRIGVGLGAVLVGVFGLLKGVYGETTLWPVFHRLDLLQPNHLSFALSLRWQPAGFRQD